MIVMSGDRALFERGEADVKAARKLFPNQGLQEAAAAFARPHERCVQYLEQAPVLVFGAVAGGAGVRRTNALYLAHKLVPLCERGARLREVMRSFDLPLPLRKLKGWALQPSLGHTVAALGQLPPEVLGQIIPVKPGKQKTWLLALKEWRSQMGQHRRAAAHGFAWAAVALSRSGAGWRDTGVVADFYALGDAFNEAWGWARAYEEASRWHGRITVERALKGTPFGPDSQIDLGPQPDYAHIDGFDFFALRTPLAIVEEGAIMHHCVGSYVPNVIRGDCHIVSVLKGRQRVATIELDRKLLVRQSRGPCNASLPNAVVFAAQRYAVEACERRQNAA